MDRDSLAHFLRLGLSLEQIGARVDRDPSTVGYWVRKHGLSAVNRDRHLARGGLERERLAALVAEGSSYRKMADELGVSTTTVQYWLKKFELRTKGSMRRGEGTASRVAGLAVIRRHCRHHGETDFFLEGRGSYRCLKCRRERVKARRRQVKETLVAEAGGRCSVCGYDRSAAALRFHHLDPSDKTFGLAERGLTRSIARCREETRKCALICANCHAEVESGTLQLPVQLKSAVVNPGSFPSSTFGLARFRGSSIGRAGPC